MDGLLWLDSAYAPWSFLLVTITLGGAAAFSSGRALAQTWRPLWQAFVYTAALAAASGFMHYVLFGEPAISGARIAAAIATLSETPGSALAELATALRHYAVMFVTLSLFAFMGYSLTRSRAMRCQYGFEIAREASPSAREQA